MWEEVLATDGGHTPYISFQTGYWMEDSYRCTSKKLIFSHAEHCDRGAGKAKCPLTHIHIDFYTHTDTLPVSLGTLGAQLPFE